MLLPLAFALLAFNAPCIQRWLQRLEGCYGRAFNIYPLVCSLAPICGDGCVDVPPCFAFAWLRSHVLTIGHACSHCAYEEISCPVPTCSVVGAMWRSTWPLFLAPPCMCCAKLHMRHASSVCGTKVLCATGACSCCCVCNVAVAQSLVVEYVGW